MESTTPLVRDVKKKVLASRKTFMGARIGISRLSISAAAEPFLKIPTMWLGGATDVYEQRQEARPFLFEA